MNQGKLKPQQGIALISVLFIAAVVLILASTFIYMVFRERQATNTSRMVSDALQVADAISERARLQIVDIHEASSLTSTNFVKNVYSVLNGGSSSISLVNSYVNTAQPITINGKQGWWKIVAASEVTNIHTPPEIMYIDIAATAETGSGVQTVIRRINMGQSPIFDLAMLSKKTDCIYCHLQVNGDVGSLGDLRPGWGEENGGGIGSGGELGGSLVNGDTFIAKKASQDDSDLSTDPARINGATFNGSVAEDYAGNRLPQDKDGDNNPDFPVINRAVALANAEGTLSGGKIYTVALGGTLASIPASGNQASINKTYNGNVILEGTIDDPIVIDGDVYFDGDVIIKGYVQGRGGIYSGRNTYVAGNINYIDPPENCATKSNPDKCAEDAIIDKKDELRLAARGNIIMGDYTEFNADGTQETWQERQAPDFFRSQFGLSDMRCYDTQTSDELEFVGSDYKNIDGTVIPYSNVECPSESYTYSMRPGKVNSDGSFSTWVSDDLYQGILGEEERKYDLWRYNVEQSSLTLTNVQEQFAKYNLSNTSLKDILDHGTGDFNLTDTTDAIIGTAHWDDGLDTIRVMIDEAFSYEKQITHLDAFIYANQRIAGKTFNAPLVINGGMIAQEIGVLAPGIERPWWAGDSRYDFLGNTSYTTNLDCGKESFIENNFTDGIDLNLDGSVDSDDDSELSTLYQPDAVDCALTINYDYRLRNGGLGFNLISSDIGQTINWQIADKVNQQVKP